MRYAKWNDALLTGDTEVDAQHRALYDLVNDLSADALLDDNPALTEIELERILRYAANHFATEESLMDRTEYPRRAEHIAIHHEFARAATDMVEAHLSGDGPTLPDLAAFMEDWLEHHIHDEDMPLVEHVRQRGAT
jgi:hemerythrin